MYFKKLEVFGFKSFAEKAELLFEPGVTAVVGPNGCGKTNVSDSIRWVLGEQSAKQLRGQKMEDVIFNGSRSRQALGMAEVSLTLDNSQNTLPVDFSEITVTRRLFRSGESEYLLNKVPCRHKDISELFMDTGVGTDAYSTLENKQIEMILNSKPEDRRFLFEEAAGVMKYKVRKNEALHKLEQTAQNLLRLGDVISEVKTRIGSLDYQARKARQYQKHQQELKTLELNSYSYNWNQLRQQAEQFNSLELHYGQGTEKINAEIATCESRIAEIKLELTSLDEQIVAAQQKAFGIDSGIARLEDKIFGSEERKKELEKKLEDVAKEKWELEEKLKSLQLEQKNIKEEKEALQVRIGELEKAFNQKSGRQSEIINETGARAKELEEEKAVYIDLLNKIAQGNNSLTSLTAEQKNAQILSEKLANQNNALNGQIKGLETRIEQLNAQCQGKTESYNQLLQEQTKLTGAKQEKQQQLSGVEKNLETTKNEFNLKSSLLSSLIQLKSTFAGYEEGVKQILTNRPAGVLGSLPEIIEVTREEYAPLVEIALAEKLQYLICNDKETIDRLIPDIKANNLSRVTLVNLSEIRGLDNRKIDPQTKLSSYIKCDERYRKMIDYFLGEVAVAQDLNAARQLLTGGIAGKVVTLAGEILTADGIITISGKTDSGLLGREIQIKHLQEESDRLNLQVTELQANRGSLSGVITGLDEQLQAYSGNIQNMLLELGSMQKDNEQANVKLRELQTETGTLQQEELELSRQLSGRQGELDNLVREQAGREQEAARAKEGLALKERELVDINSRLAVLQDELTTLKVELAAGREKKDNYEVLNNRFAQNQADLEAEIAKVINEHNEMEKQLGDLDRIKGEVEENINKLLAEKKEADSTLEKLRVRKQEQIINVRAQEAKIDSWRHEADSLQEQKHEQEIKYTQVNTQLEQVSSLLREKYNMEISQETMPAELAVPDEEEIGRVKKKIESLGPVNLVAIDEYEQLQERYNFLLKQQEDMTRAQEDIHKVITKINQTTKEYFEKTFTQVQANFTNLFRQLFEGGEAELVLTNPDDLLETGIDINVQPPGKKLTNITLLSGGEKALTAIAILFAIFLVKPSPFCVLDEIDAPLDDSNLNRFIRMLKEFSGRTQFIIITHNKKTMEMADVLYGVTMEEFGVSKLVSVKFKNAVPA